MLLPSWHSKSRSLIHAIIKAILSVSPRKSSQFVVKLAEKYRIEFEEEALQRASPPNKTPPGVVVRVTDCHRRSDISWTSPWRRKTPSSSSVIVKKS